jgi:hypothetical protein
MAKFAARNTCTQVVATDTDSIIFDRIGEIIVSFGHGSDKNANTFVFVQSLDIVSHAYNFRIEAERDLSAVGRKVIRNGVFDHLD